MGSAQSVLRFGNMIHRSHESTVSRKLRIDVQSVRVSVLLSPIAVAI